MWKGIGYDKCVSFIECQFRLKNEFPKNLPRPVITISRMAGAGGHAVASKLVEYMHLYTPTHCEWVVFDRDLVKKALEDHHLHKRIADFMHEGNKSIFTDTLEELLGLHPSAWTLVEYTTETILRLAHMGNVVLVGRGSSVITGKLPTAFHIRLIGSLEKRTARVQEVYNFDEKAALQFIKKEDEGRRLYLKNNFDKDINDPLLYHLVINTDLVKYEEAARCVGDEVIRRFHLDQRLQTGEESRPGPLSKPA